MRCVSGGQSTLTRYVSVVPGAWVDTAAFPAAKAPWLVAGTFKNFLWVHNSAPTSGRSFTYTLVHNDVDTSVVITIADLATSGSDTANSVTVAPGDTLYWRRTSSGSPLGVATRCTVQFDGAVVGESGHCGLTQIVSATATNYVPTFSPFAWTTSPSDRSLVATPGTLTNLSYQLSDAPGAGKSRQFALFIDNVIQDGSLGTTDTRVTISDSAVTGSWTGSIVLSVSQTVSLRSTASGTPTASVAGVACKFVATTDGESNCGRPATIGVTASTTYLEPLGSLASLTESDTSVEGGVGDSVVLRDWRIRLSGSAGSDGGHTFMLRKNGADTAQTFSILTSSTSGSDLVNEVTIAAGDVWNWRRANIPNALTRDGWIGWVQYALSSPTPIIGTAVFGAYGTPTSSLTFLANLDGVTRTVHAEKSLAIGGNLMLIEQASAPAGIANTGRIYTEDNGAGKTRLMVQFGTGAAVQIAIEP